MNKPSSTIQAAGAYGFIAATLLMLVAVFFPEYYARIPPGYQLYLVVGISTIGGYFKKENVLGASNGQV